MCFTIIKDAMDVSAAVVKLREKESNIRKFHDPVADTILDAVGFGVVARTCFRQLYRTDAAHDVFINLVRCIKHFCTVGRFPGISYTPWIRMM